MLSGAHVVTGGASGLGAAIADAIAQAGGTPVVFDRAACEGPHDSAIVDVSDRDAVEDAVARTAQKYGSLASVVGNAGVDACGPLDRVDPQARERVLAVNLVGIASLVRAALPHLYQSGGRVVTVASTLGLRAVGDATAYCASKFGVVGFTRALSAEVAGRIGVTLLVPGGMATRFFDGRDPQYKPGPDAHLNPPQNVANAAVFALSQPPGCDVRELLICPWGEASWP
jgi:NAD(P)-dependent dehydrogenase (short-subunit alcohol dehydrogenase family)